jgi:hypothetical protein
MRAAQLSTRSCQAIIKGWRTAALMLASCMFVLLVATGAYAQTDDGEESANPSRRAAGTAKSIITGKVVYDDTGRPVRRASLLLIDLLSAQQSPDKFSTATDNDGKFRLKNVAAGTYLVMVDAPGVLTPFAFLNPAENRPPTSADWSDARKNFDEVVVDGTNDVKLEVRAKRGAAISGKITYKDGDPAISVLISIVRKKGDGGVGRFIAGLSPASLLAQHTDDRGMYRVAGLPPGEYFVSAAESNTNVEDENAASGRNMDRFMRDLFTSDALAVTYYGGVRSIRDATTVKLVAGEEADDINISLIEQQSFVLGGTLTARRDHRPLPRATLKLHSKEDYGGLFPTDRTTQTDEQGGWGFKGVPDGTYLISIEPPYETSEPTTATDGAKPATPRAAKLSRKQLEVTVNGSDMTALAIELNEGARVSGSFTFEGSGKSSGYVSMGIERIDGVIAPEEEYASIDRDKGTFSFEGLMAGEFFLTANVYKENYYIKSMTANGRDMLREPFKLNESDEVRGVEIVLASDLATLSVRVLDKPGGKPRGSVFVTLVPNIAQRWRAQSSRIYLRTDGSGQLKVSIPPGDYLAFVLPPDKAPEVFNESYVKTHAASAQRVTLHPGAHQTADFILPGPQN